jgi:hypothetical protein
MVDGSTGLDRLVSGFVSLAIEAVENGVPLADVMQAHLNTYLNLVALYGVDAGHTQEVFREVAERIPEFIAKVELNNSETAGSA